jgi:NAD(P)H-dependent flavin oxidoreductase YrpB (nitropropane dioxygenase family)
MKNTVVKKLVIGQHSAPFPLLLGGMGVRVTGARLAGHVARCGGFGTVAAAGIGVNSPYYNGHNFFAADVRAFQEEIRKAYQIAPEGVIGVNCMVAVTNYDDMVRAACEAGAKFIVSGAGLPMNLPALTADYPQVALIPIVSSARAAQLIARKWSQNYHRLPDAVVVEDPDTAGGHLGEKPENIGTGRYDQYETVRQVKDHFQQVYQKHVPVIAAGGIWDRQDVLQALAQGADAVQMASRFVCTEECDADPAFKQAYVDSRPEDIGLVMSPAGLPGRALVGNIERIRQADLDSGSGCMCACLKKCTYKENGDRFCIIKALDRAQRGDVDTGLIFCGTNAWKADRITTVQAVFDELFILSRDAHEHSRCLVVNA